MSNWLYTYKPSKEQKFEQWIRLTVSDFHRRLPSVLGKQTHSYNRISYMWLPVRSTQGEQCINGTAE